MSTYKHFLVVSAVLLAAVGSFGGELGFLEDFSLADDRAAALRQLVPGTDDYYYYHCLHYQSRGERGKLQDCLSKWIKRSHYTPRTREVLNRQALLDYPLGHKKTLDYLKRELGLDFQHQRETLEQEPSCPTALDQSLVSFESYQETALRNYQDLGGFTDQALDLLATMELNPDQRRDWLRRLKLPDVPKLPELVVADLKYKYSGGFGSLDIHSLMTLEQLAQCLVLAPDLLNQESFVKAYLAKLRPADLVNWRDDPAETDAYLKRLWDFAKTLAPVHNSLKANILYQRLKLDLSRGVHDPGLFLDYVKLPRRAKYVNPVLLRSVGPGGMVDRGRNYKSSTGLPPLPAHDFELVKAYLQLFFLEGASWRDYDAYILDTTLKHIYAETKIVNGVGDPEEWASLLPPKRYQELRERVDLDFSPENKPLFRPGDKVSLAVAVKNVAKLHVKVYALNLLNYYKQRRSEPGLDLELGGLTPNFERTLDFPGLSPFRRTLRRVELPELDKRGAWVVELIGNGKTSRALVRKGALRFFHWTTAAGYAFNVFDDDGRKVADPKIWLDGHEYRADQDGVVMLPFSREPGERKIVLSDGSFHALGSFDQGAESYSLRMAVCFDRESLVRRQDAKVVVRPALFVDGQPVTMAVLKDVVFRVVCHDALNGPVERGYPGVQLSEGEANVFEFKVPENLNRLEFVLTAKVMSLAEGRELELSARSEPFPVNGVNATAITSELLLGRGPDGYALDVKGKNGEPLAGVPVQLRLWSRCFTDSKSFMLKTDAAGVIALGALKDIVKVNASYELGQEREWRLDKLAAARGYLGSCNFKAGEEIKVPYMGAAAAPDRLDLALLERRGGTFRSDLFDKLSLQDGFVHIRPLPTGTYTLLLKGQDVSLDLNVSPGEAADGLLLGKDRIAELDDANPAQLLGAEAKGGDLEIRLSGVTDDTRVHVLAMKWLPDQGAFDQLDSLPFPGRLALAFGVAKSRYESGRTVGEEVEYILSRRASAKYPGNMLGRPGLLLNPFSLRQTETKAEADAKGGETFSAGAADLAKSMSAEGFGAAGGAGGGEGGSFPAFDFLANAAPVFLNLRPGKDGKLSIPLDKLGASRDVQVVAVDHDQTMFRRISLPPLAAALQDVRLAKGLDPAKHFVRARRITALQPGEAFKVEDLSASQFMVYDSLGMAFDLLRSLLGAKGLAGALDNFSFLKDWASLPPAVKRGNYSKFACHELNFFLHRKDPEFFKAVVLPFLKNKREKTFLDDWLLGAPLDGYLSPYLYVGRLNMAEKALLPLRAPGQALSTRRYVREALEMLPPDPAARDALFNSALNLRALSGEELAVPAAPPQEALEAAVKVDADLAEPRNDVSFAMAAPKGKLGRAPAPMPAMAMAASGPKPAKANRKKHGGKDSARKLRESSVMAARKKVVQYYRAVDKTREFAENNYYQLPLAAQGATLVKANAFWDDFAARGAVRPFLSGEFIECADSFVDAALALGALDLPFKSPGVKLSVDKGSMTIVPAGPALVFHKDIVPAVPAQGKLPILLSQDFFRNDDQYVDEGFKRLEKYVSGEFLTNVAYGSRVVVTNPTSAVRMVEVLAQIPAGAAPLQNGFYTNSLHLSLAPYSTRKFEFLFYFPEPGSYPCFPAHASSEGDLLAFCAPRTLAVVDKPTQVDKDAWGYVSQFGADDEVFAYLAAHNLNRVELAKIAFRMRDKACFARAVKFLSDNHAFDPTLWSYGVYHDDLPVVRQYLEASPFASSCGDWLASEPLSLDPEARRAWQFLEYKPYINARVRPLGKTRKILNEALFNQYQALLKTLSYKAAFDDDDLLAITYYLLLQDRVDEALKFFKRVDPASPACRLQRDYLGVYLDFYLGDLDKAMATVKAYQDYPVEHWRAKFAEALAQLEEIKGAASSRAAAEETAGGDQRDIEMARRAQSQPVLDLELVDDKVSVRSRNLKRCAVNYYFIDIERLFSGSPFAEDRSGQFDFVEPNRSESLDLSDSGVAELKLPAELLSRNFLLELAGEGVSASKPHYGNSMAVLLEGNYGQLQALSRDTGKPLAGVYVKAYAKLKDGSVKFHKDGYTDLRGRFDYASLSSTSLDDVAKFSILVLGDANGAVVKEVLPPGASPHFRALARRRRTIELSLPISERK